MRARRFVSPAVLFVLVIAAPVTVRAKDPPLRSWLDGPIRYVATPPEMNEFRSLRTDPERAAYIERFWRRRDPTPATLANEYRQLFWQRVREANEKFLDSASPGWKTDRGKIYILYGPPDEDHEDPVARTGSGDDAGSGLIRWIYRGRAGGRKDIDPGVIVPFVRDASGEYRLSYDPQLSSPFFNAFDIEDKNTAGLGTYLQSMRPTNRDPLGVMLDLGKLQEVPPQEEILIAAVETVEAFAYERLPLEIDRFVTPASELLALITVSIPGPPGSEPPTILARLTKPGTKEGARILAEGSFRVDGEGPSRIAQGRVALGGGPWDTMVLAVDPASGANRVFRGRIEPLGTTGFSMSDVVVARALAPVPYAIQASYTDPYLIGGFRVTPQVTAGLPRGEPLRLFYEIYGGVEPYRIAYQLEGQENDGRWRPLGKPQEREARGRGQGFELPTAASWPPGAYRIRMHAVDAAGASLDRIVPFSVAEK